MIPVTIATPGPPLVSAALPLSMSPAATSPWPTKTDLTVIIFNGEIFNHADLRPSLEQAGHRYTTRSDTETILHSYEQYGPECVLRLRGMFAFAIWDKNARKLFCARDRLGKKPFYYYWDGRTIRLRQRNQGSPRTPLHLPPIRGVPPPRIPRLRLRQRRPHPLPRHPQTDAGTSPHARSLFRVAPAADPPILGDSGSPARERAVIPPGSPNAATASNRPSACAS